MKAPHAQAVRLDIPVLVKGLHDLEDRSPARRLREGHLDEVGPLVLTAARAFAATGLTVEITMLSEHSRCILVVFE